VATSKHRDAAVTIEAERNLIFSGYIAEYVEQHGDVENTESAVTVHVLEDAVPNGIGRRLASRRQRRDRWSGVVLFGPVDGLIKDLRAVRTCDDDAVAAVVPDR
jgi:hypothetical protein